MHGKSKSSSTITSFRLISHFLSSGSCIKGHRSSSCHHTDRPLFEIKKKGRPVSQCDKCRELRKQKQKHVKCNCPGVFVPPASSSSGISSNTTCSLTTPSSRAGISSIWSPRIFLTYIKLDSIAQRKLPTNPTFPNGLQGMGALETTPSASNSKQRGIDVCRQVYLMSTHSHFYVDSGQPSQSVQMQVYMEMSMFSS